MNKLIKAVILQALLLLTTNTEYVTYYFKSFKVTYKISAMHNKPYLASTLIQCYKYKVTPELIIKSTSETWESGMKLAGRTCFHALTNGTYQGEERSLNIIDICANPVRCH